MTCPGVSAALALLLPVTPTVASAQQGATITGDGTMALDNVQGIGTFGVPEGSRVARDLEHILTEDGADADAARARALAAELRDAVDAGPQPG